MFVVDIITFNAIIQCKISLTKNIVGLHLCFWTLVLVIYQSCESGMHQFVQKEIELNWIRFCIIQVSLSDHIKKFCHPIYQSYELGNSLYWVESTFISSNRPQLRPTLKLHPCWMYFIFDILVYFLCWNITWILKTCW